MDNNLLDIKKFKDIKELQEYSKAQFLTLLSVNKRIEELETENRSLKQELERLKSPNNVEILLKSNEQDLCEIEIKRLKDIAFNRALSLEETKKLDLLVKNLYIAKKKNNADINPNYKKLEELSDSELIKIANVNDERE